MKTIVLWFSALLLATFTLTGCSSGDDENSAVIQPQTGNNDQDGNGVTGDDRSIDLPEVQTLDATTFNAYIVGKGWMEKESHRINKDGMSYQKKEYWKDMVGAAPMHYAFTNDMARIFRYVPSSQASPYCYADVSWQYNGQTNMLTLGEGEQIKVLSASKTELHVIHFDYGEGRDENNEYRRFSLYTIYRPMTDGELQQTLETYWVNVADLNRQMTPQDIQHKWVLVNYTGDDNLSHYVSEDRSDDKNYIRFASDGTFEGRAKGTEFSGTYDFNGTEIVLTPYVSVEQGADNYFLERIWNVHYAKIVGAGALVMVVGNGSDINSFHFIRGKE